MSETMINNKLNTGISIQSLSSVNQQGNLRGRADIPQSTEQQPRTVADVVKDLKEALRGTGLKVEDLSIDQQRLTDLFGKGIKLVSDLETATFPSVARAAGNVADFSETKDLVDKKGNDADFTVEDDGSITLEKELTSEGRKMAATGALAESLFARLDSSAERDGFGKQFAEDYFKETQSNENGSRFELTRSGSDPIESSMMEFITTNDEGDPEVDVDAAKKFIQSLKADGISEPQDVSNFIAGDLLATGMAEGDVQKVLSDLDLPEFAVGEFAEPVQARGTGEATGRMIRQFGDDSPVAERLAIMDDPRMDLNVSADNPAARSMMMAFITTDEDGEPTVDVDAAKKYVESLKADGIDDAQAASNFIADDLALTDLDDDDIAAILDALDLPEPEAIASGSETSGGNAGFTVERNT